MFYVLQTYQVEEPVPLREAGPKYTFALQGHAKWFVPIYLTALAWSQIPL